LPLSAIPSTNRATVTLEVCSKSFFSPPLAGRRSSSTSNKGCFLLLFPCSCTTPPPHFQVYFTCARLALCDNPLPILKTLFLLTIFRRLQGPAKSPRPAPVPPHGIKFRVPPFPSPFFFLLVRDPLLQVLPYFEAGRVLIEWHLCCR